MLPRMFLQYTLPTCIHSQQDRATVRISQPPLGEEWILTLTSRCYERQLCDGFSDSVRGDCTPICSCGAKQEVGPRRTGRRRCRYWRGGPRRGQSEGLSVSLMIQRIRHCCYLIVEHCFHSQSLLSSIFLPIGILRAMGLTAPYSSNTPSHAMCVLRNFDRFA